MPRPQMQAPQQSPTAGAAAQDSKIPSSGTHLGSASPPRSGDGLLQVRQVAAAGVQGGPRLRRRCLGRQQQGGAHPRSRHLLLKGVQRALGGGDGPAGPPQPHLIVHFLRVPCRLPPPRRRLQPAAQFTLGMDVLLTRDCMPPLVARAASSAMRRSCVCHQLHMVPQPWVDLDITFWVNLNIVVMNAQRHLLCRPLRSPRGRDGGVAGGLPLGVGVAGPAQARP